MLKAILFCTSSAFLGMSIPANALELLGPELHDLIIFSDAATTIAAGSQIDSGILAGGAATLGASSRIIGNLLSVGAATAGANATITGNLASGGALTIGAGTIVEGSSWSGGTATIGALSTVDGDIVTAGAATIGAGSRIGGNVRTGGVATIGADAIISGNLAAAGATTLGAGSVVTSQSVLSGPPAETSALTATLSNTVAIAALQVAAAQTALDKMSGSILLAPAITTDMTLFGGVYRADSLSLAPGTTLTLDGQGLSDQFWVFDITAMLVTGASSHIVLINAGSGSSIIWNTGGYASLGANSTLLGTVLATSYVDVGAEAIVSGIGNNCGAILSALSSVTIGAGAHVGGNGCSGIDNGFIIDPTGAAVHRIFGSEPPPSHVPEPASWAMMIAGFAMTGAAMRHRQARPVLRA